MIRDLTEQVLVYRQADLDAWKRGDKSMAPGFYPTNLISYNQPSYGFAEFLTLRHYHELYGWLGFVHYDLGTDDRCPRRRRLGREKVQEVIPPDRLRRLRALQSDQRRWPGKPDLFLYRDSGDYMFVEVKKGQDKLRQAQFRSIAEIMSVLRCPVDVVYVREESQRYEAKRYAFNLERFGGHRVR